MRPRGLSSPPFWHATCSYPTDMITLTRLNGARLCVNAFLIEHLEETPDTVVTLTNGHRFLVQESIDEIIVAAASFLARLREDGANPITIGQLGRVR